MTDALIQSIVTVSADTLLIEVLHKISQTQSRAIAAKEEKLSSETWQLPKLPPNCALVTENDRLVGILTGKNIIRAVTTVDIHQTSIRSVMTSPVISLPQAQLTQPSAIARCFHDHSIHHLPVVDEQGHPLGLLTSEQFLKYQLNIQLQDEIVRHQETEEALKNRIRLEELVTKISGQFIHRKATQIDDGIHAALKAIGEFTGADRSYLFRFSDDQQRLSNTHEWCAPYAAALCDRYKTVPITHYAPDIHHFYQFRSFSISQAAESDALALPECDRLLHRTADIQSAIQVPIVLEQSLLGFIGLDAERSPRPWAQDIKMLLILVGEIIANALKRQRAEITLEQSMSTNRALLNALPDAILRITRDGVLVNYKPDPHGVIPVPDEDFLGKHLTDVFPADIAHPALRCVEQALTTKAIQHFEYQLTLGSALYDYEARFAVSDIHEVMVIIRDISDRKRAQAELQRAKDQLRAVLDAVPGLISWVDADLIYQGVNTRMAETFGRSPEDFVKQPIGFLGGRLEFNTFMKDFFASDDLTATRETPIDIHGEMREYLSVAQKYANNQVAVFVGIDITERKQAESQLQASKQFLQLVVDNIPEAIFWKDRQSTYLGCNLAFARSVGLDSPTALGKDSTDFDLYPKEMAAQYQRKERRIMEAGQPDYHIIETHVQADGRPYWIDKNLIPLYDSYGNIMGILGTCEDITERRAAEQQLRQSEERYRTLAKNFPNGAVLLFDHQLCHTIADGTGLAPMNLSKDTLEGRLLWDVFPSEIAQQLEPHYRKTLTGQPDSLELTLSDRTYLFQFTPLTDRQGDCFAGMVTTQDITKYKRVEQDIRNALEKEKQLNELKSRFITMASHEFRTPLATILGSSEILRYFGQKCSDEKRLKHYNRIQTGVEQMTRLLDDVLIIGRAEAGRLPFQPIAIDIVAFCTNLTEELQLSIADKKTIALRLQFQPPAIAQSVTIIHADEQLLRQILTNLLSNAIKYSHPGDAVDFSIILESDAVLFSVCDRGIGIPQDDLPHLFEQFHRAGNVGTTQGTGLGLSIVKKSVELHGGSIQVSSLVGQGTTMTVTLPLDRSSCSDR